MKTDAKQGRNGERGDLPAGNESRMSESRAEGKPRGNWLFRLAMPLVAGLALVSIKAANTGCADNTNLTSDVEGDGDVAAEVEEDVLDADASDVPDAEDIREEGSEDTSPEMEEDGEPDSDVLDADDVPDLTDELVEDVGPDEEADVPDVLDVDDTLDVAEDAEPEAEDVEDIPDITDELIEDVEEADTYDCTEISRTEETPTDLPEPVCSGTQTVSDLDYVVEWVGADCDGASSTSTRVGKVLTLSSGVDTSDLTCIRARTTSTPQGDETLVAATATSLETATAIACADMTVGETLDGGAGEHKFRLTDVRASEVTGSILDQDWMLARNVRVYLTGNVGINSERGVIAAEFNPSALTARVCIIELPTLVRNNGDVESWASYGDFRFNTIVSGARMQGWGWTL